MTLAEFRRMALSFPQTEERSHMNHPDFRAAGRIFATVGYPDNSHGMVQVTPVEQQILIEAEPEVFSPCAGAWGRNGSTSVNLKVAKKASIKKALLAAWELAIAKGPAKKASKRPVKKKNSSRK
jgi:hypothetical protein